MVSVPHDITNLYKHSSVDIHKLSKKKPNNTETKPSSYYS